MQYPANTDRQKDDVLLNTHMQYTIKGTLNTQAPSVQAYAHTLAQRIRRDVEFNLRSTAKMLYWLENPDVELVHPIVIVEHPRGITGVHPGRTRFLAAVLLNRPCPCVVRTHNKRTTTTLNALRVDAYKPRRVQTVHAFEHSLRDVYMARAKELEQEYAHLSAYEFYCCVLGVQRPSA